MPRYLFLYRDSGYCANCEEERDGAILLGSLNTCDASDLAGIPVVVFEKNGAPGEGDWNMGLHWSVPILKSLIPDDAVVKLQSVEVDLDVPTKPIDTPAFLNGSTGEVIVAPEIPNFRRLRRSKLRA